MGYLGGLIFDLTRSYDMGFVLLGILSSIAIASTYLIREERHSI
jgi:hypothetical protein